MLGLLWFLNGHVVREVVPIQTDEPGMAKGVGCRDPDRRIVDQHLLQQVEAGLVELFDLILQVVVAPIWECGFVVR